MTVIKKMLLLSISFCTWHNAQAMSYEEQQARMIIMTADWGDGPTNDDNKLTRMGILYSLKIVLKVLNDPPAPSFLRRRQGFYEIKDGRKVTLTDEQIAQQRDLVINTITTLLENSAMAEFCDHLSSSENSLDAILGKILNPPDDNSE